MSHTYRKGDKVRTPYGTTGVEYGEIITDPDSGGWFDVRTDQGRYYLNAERVELVR